MAPTYEPIATTTLGTAAATITFSSIPATYTDLILVTNLSYTAGGATLMRFNSDTGNNYSYTYIYGDGTSAASSKGQDRTSIVVDLASGFDTTLFGMFTANIFSYAGSTNKTILIENSNDKNGSGTVERSVRLWRNTSAITSISLTHSASTFKAGTTATLYGILKA
jgi:hypothetical protein